MGIIGVLLFAVGVQAPALPPSFDCSKANEVISQTICGDPKLAEADAIMARLFAAARTTAFGEGPSGELAVQREWLKQRQDCRVPDSRVYKSRGECLAGRYNERNHELAVAALFTEPELSLQTLRKLDPEATPLYEAIILYANGPKGWTWNKAPQQPQMLKLLQPYFDRFQSDEDASFGRDILADEGIRTLPDTLKSQKHFIEFLQISSAYLRGDPIPRPLPCAAILRRPGLLEASGPVFGSTLDNFIFYPDCATTLPPLPKFDALIKAINDGWPDCDGTIRFSAYRMYDQAQNEARIATRRDIEGFAKSKEDSARQIPSVGGVSVAKISAAISELALYYQKYQQVAAADARAFAKSKVRGLMADGHNCGG